MDPHEDKTDQKHDEGTAPDGGRSSWVADKTVHATVDSINSAVSEMIADEGGLPPVTPPGEVTPEGEGPTDDWHPDGPDKKTHASA